VFDLALSTMWAIGRFQNLADFFDEAKTLGFSRFELNHAVDSTMLKGLVLEGKVPSVHEPCPADISTSVLKDRDWLVSATDEENRQHGVAAIQRSIDLAHRLGASAVVVHPGRVEVDAAYEETLVKLYRQGKVDQPEFAAARQRFVSARAALAGVHMQSVRRSMFELAEYADRMGIRLGLENRYHYLEIPLPDELDELLNLDLGETVGYWYDVGHAQVLQHQGFVSHQEWLDRFAARMIGVHFHDVVGINDHLAAGRGRVDWDRIARYLPKDILRTCEFQYSNSPQEVVAGVQWLVEKGCA
jgi:sugar phosphate isomerase/epimerase